MSWTTCSAAGRWARSAARRPCSTASPTWSTTTRTGSAPADDLEAIMAIETVNPATGETLKTFDPMTAEQVDRVLDRAEAGFATLRGTTFAQRAAWMSAAADRLDHDQATVAALMT